MDEIKNIQLSLGDIIQISSLRNKTLHDKIFLIQYIDENTIDIVNKEGMISLRIEDKKMADKSINSIKILYTNPVKGYTNQNDLVTGKWIHVYFNDEELPHIMGIISDHEEDSIEIQSYPNDELIYIDFGYMGLPKDLNIDRIVIKDNPPEKIKKKKDNIKQEEKNKESDEENVNSDSDRDGVDDETQEETIINTTNLKTDVDGFDDETYEEQEYPLRTVDDEDSEDNKPDKIIDVDINKTIEEVKTIKILEDLDDIVQYKASDIKERRYGIQIQIDDLLGNIMSKIPKNRQTKRKIENVNKQINRFVELRQMFSKIDQYNVASMIDSNINDIPLLNNIVNLEQIPNWIVPVVTQQNKIYNISVEDARISNDVFLITPSQIADEFDMHKNYLHNGGSTTNIYKNYLNQLQYDFTPFKLPIDEYGYKYHVNDRLKCIVQNKNENYTSSCIINNNLNTNCVFQSQQYIPSNSYKKYDEHEKKTNLYPLKNEDEIIVKSFIFNPTNIKSACVDFNETSVLDKVINYETNDLSKHNVEKEYFDIRDDYKKKQSDFSLLNKPLHVIYDHDNNINSDTLRGYLEKILPLQSEISPYLNKLRDENNVFLSFDKIFKLLQPFSINTLNVQQSLFDETKSFFEYERKSYNQKINNSKRQFSGFLEIKSKYDPDVDTTKMDIPDKNVDYFRLHFSELSHKNIELVSVDNIDDNINTYIDKLTNTNKKEKKDIKKCNKDITIAKLYYTREKLEEDIIREHIYFDKDYDDVTYELANVYDKKRKTMNITEFRDFLVEKIISINDFDKPLAKEHANAIIEGRRRVKNGHYAALSVDEGETLEYYKLENNKWVLDTEYSEKNNNNYNLGIDGTDCDDGKDCISDDNDCIEMDEILRRNNKSLLESMLSEFSHSVLLAKETNESYLTDLIENLKKKKESLISINNNEHYKYNNLQKQIAGQDSNIVNFDKSPYYDIFFNILNIEDFKTKQEQLVYFVNVYCREYLPNEDSNWYYCKETNVKLVPSFLITLASTYIHKGDYVNVLNTICINQGQISDDGDSWVDEHSGFVIRNIDFSSADEYDNKGFIQLKETIDTDDINNLMDDTDLDKELTEFYIMSQEESNIENIVEFNKTTKGVNNKHIMIIIDIISKELKLKLTYNSLQYIIYYTNHIFNKKYSKKNLLETRKLHTITMLCVCILFIALQLFHENEIKLRVYPGCNLSLNGFPMDESSNEGISFFSCLLLKLSKKVKKYNYFKQFSKTDDENKLTTALKNTILNHILTEPSIYQDIIKKQNILEHGINTNSSSQIDYSLSKWNYYLPPLISFDMKNVDVQFFTSGFYETVEKQQHEKLFSFIDKVRSKMTFHSFHLIKLIENIIDKKGLLMRSLSGVQYIENACCNENNVSKHSHVIDYFKEENKLISQLIMQCDENNILLKNLLRNVYPETIVFNIKSNSDK